MISYSVIIPAYNEAAWLTNTLDALHQAMSSVDISGEVIVVDNNSTDRTSEIARERGAVVVFEPVNQISRARNAGARAARGRYLIFLDADTLVSGELLKKAMDCLSSGSCCGGGAEVSYEGDIPRIARIGTGLWNSLSHRFRMAAGCFVFCRKDGFGAVGGFSQAVYASEEIWFSWKLLKWGKPRGLSFRIIDHPPVITSSRKLRWYSLPQIFGMVLIFAFFPFAFCFRSLCRLWYDRPAQLDRRVRR